MTRPHGKIAQMNSLPLVGAEVQRINAAFAAISGELSGVLASLRDADLTRVGTPAADPAVEVGMADLQLALSRLQATADGCTSAMSRHGVERSMDPASESPSGDTEQGGQQ